VLILAPGQIEEVGEVLSRPKIVNKYRIVPGDRHAFLGLVSAEALLLPHGQAPGVCRDVAIVNARAFLAVRSAEHE
jgi:hypothetical protein